jgi:hypothetical protein
MAHLTLWLVNLMDRFLDTYTIGHWVDLRTNLDLKSKTKYLLLPGTKPRSSSLGRLTDLH